jgi:hypothetical protein
MAPSPEPVPCSTREYDIGYRKPPKHSRFRPGQSGNPKGRPKGARSLNTLAREVFGQTVIVKTAGGERKMNAVELGLNKLRELAARGDLKAIQAVLDHWGRIVPEPVEAQASASLERRLAPEEEQILEHLLGSLHAPVARLAEEAGNEN